MKKIDKEIILGGVFGAIAIVAVIVQMILGGFSADAIAGGIKDIAGTMVAVTVFLIAVRQYVKEKPKKSFEERMNYALDKWCEENSNMIVRNAEIDGGKYGIGMKTDVKDFYLKQAVTKNAGRFLQMPLITRENYEKDKIEIDFFLNKGTFFSHLKGTEDELMPKYQELNSLFCGLINTKFGDFAYAGGKNKAIKVTINQAIIIDEDIEKLIELINTMYQAYLVSANLEK